jgi:hypothetical protein
MQMGGFQLSQSDLLVATGDRNQQHCACGLAIPKKTGGLKRDPDLPYLLARARSAGLFSSNPSKRKDPAQQRM